MTDPAVTYSSYLKIDDLLSLQQPRSEGPEPDEMLFIVIHQVYELWFKELLHEFDRVRRLLEDDESHRAQHTLKRILTILKVMVAQLEDRKSTRLNSSHVSISYAVFCLKKKTRPRGDLKSGPPLDLPAPRVLVPVARLGRPLPRYLIAPRVRRPDAAGSAADSGLLRGLR